MTDHDTKAELDDLIRQNYCDITGRKTIPSATLKARSKMPQDTRHECVLALADVKNKDKILLVAYYDTQRKMLGVKTDYADRRFLRDIFLGLDGTPLSDGAKTQLEAEMKRIIPAHA